MGLRKALKMSAMTRKAAEAAGDMLQGDAPDVQKDASDEAIGALIELFVESYRAERNSSENTLRAYRIDLGDYAAWAKRMGVGALHPTHRQLRRYLSQLEQAQYARSTVNRRLSALRTFFQWLNVEGIVDVDPASALSGPKHPQRLPRHIRPEDMVKLLSVYAKRLDEEGRDLRTPSEMRNQAILEFLYACGARISEASGLELTAVDFEAGQCKVLGKGGKGTHRAARWIWRHKYAHVCAAWAPAAGAGQGLPVLLRIYAGKPNGHRCHAQDVQAGT